MSEVELRIVRWLKEEKLSPTMIEDPSAIFNIQIRNGSLLMNVNQNVNNADSLTISCGLIYSPEQITLLYDKMDAEVRREYFNQLKTALTIHPYIWQFNIYGEGERVKGVRLHSKRLYYGELTKDSFMHMVWFMFKIFKLPIRLIDDYFSVFWPEWTPPAVEPPSRGEGFDRDLERMR